MNVLGLLRTHPTRRKRKRQGAGLSLAFHLSGLKKNLFGGRIISYVADSNRASQKQQLVNNETTADHHCRRNSS